MFLNTKKEQNKKTEKDIKNIDLGLQTQTIMYLYTQTRAFMQTPIHTAYAHVYIYKGILQIWFKKKKVSILARVGRHVC